MSPSGRTDERPADGWRDRVQDALGAAFVLERELKSGAMSRVFVGTETALGRRVVIKMMMPQAQSSAHEDEFRREAMIAAQLHHPHIVPVFSVGTVAGVPYYTMPFIDGESLRERLEGAGALSVDAAVRVLREIGSALAFAHGLGVIHRDVKPENIVLERGTGRALLADFGIACMAGEPADAASSGTTVGTPGYMSPEQADGLELDGRTDMYSLGLVAWEMLTGDRPWRGESVYDVMYRQQHESLPALDRCGIDVPPALVAGIDRALKKNRDERWPTVDDLLIAIQPPAPAREMARGRAPFSRPLAAAALATAGAPHDRWADGADQPAFDPAAVATIAMPAGHRRRESESRRSAPTPPPQNRRQADALETRRRRVLWLAAACGATAVTAGLITAGTYNHDVVIWSAAAGDTKPSTRGVASDIIPSIDTVSMSVAAAGLASVTPDTLPSPSLQPLPETATATTPVASGSHATRAVARVPAALTSRDALRARAATATLALQAYEHVRIGQAWQLGWAPPASADTATLPPAGGPVPPAVAVRVPPRKHPAEHAAEHAAAAPPPAPDSVTPAVGVRVPVPPRPHPAAPEQ